MARLHRALRERTDGTPLFIEETVSAPAEQGALVGRPGDYRFVGDPDRLALPDTVQTVVAARVDRLPPDDKRLLQVAAVIGETVPLDILGATADLEPAAVDATRGRLQGAEFLYEAGGAGLVFKHNLIREVVYGEIPRQRRRWLHGAVADAMTASSGDAPVERPAYHCFLAERWDDGAHNLWRRPSSRSSARPTRRHDACSCSDSR